MSTNIGINGFGRIGRLVLRSILEHDYTDVNVVAVNDLTDADTLATLFKYDSAHGVYAGDVAVDDGALVVDGRRIPVLSERDPADLPWGDLDCHVVIESTGVFRTKEKAYAHIDAGAQKVVLSAPAKGTDIDATIVMGVNDDILTGEEEVISNASCTTNCLAPMAKVLDDAFGIEKGFMTTVHAYTAGQNIQDAPHKDLRRARAAAESIIPTTTGAAKTVGLVLPKMAGILDGMAVRVPVITGSLTDFTVVVKKETTVDEVNAAFEKAASTDPLQGVLDYNTDPIVSSDIIHNPASCIFDQPSTMVDGTVVKIIGWYDNEWGYAVRTVDAAIKLANLSASA
ncbi:MAG: type I glyceraldehyde-3-phosphate dehydrogenase [Bacteroidetes bacterium]|jgi:glyceraldehyde 3-phosphate dehydrogenase|nr:type I glyceraldehyde-3-phosphate dehydrogenase [Bacteroidota bacterium]